MANFVFGTVLVAMLSGAIRVLPEFVPWNKIGASGGFFLEHFPSRHHPLEPRFERSGFSFALLHRRFRTARLIQPGGKCGVG